MSLKPLLPIHVEILELLAKNNEASQYQIHKQLGVSYRNVLRRMRELEHYPQPLVKLVRVEPSRKGGKESKIYAATLNGLFFALRNPHLWKHMDGIAEYHKNELLIFRFWHLFTEQEKAILKLVVYDKYRVDKTKFGKFFGPGLNLDFFALAFEEKTLKEYLDGLFTNLVIAEPIRPIVERVEPLRKIRLEALQTKLKEKEEEHKKIVDYCRREIEKYSS